MSHEHDTQPAPQQQPADRTVHPRPGLHDGDLSYKPFADSALSQIDRILKDHVGSYAALPELFSVLTDDAKKKFREKRLRELEPVPGSIAIDCARLLGAHAGVVLSLGLKGKPPVDATALRAYLITLTGDELARIQGDTFVELKKIMPKRLLDAIPTVSEQLEGIANHPHWLKWFIETTDSGVTATLIVRHADVAVAATIEQQNLWTEWVDHVRLPVDFTRLSTLREAAKSRPDVQAKFDAVLGPRAKMNDAQRDQFQKDHANDVRKELDSGNPTLRGLLDAVGRAPIVSAPDAERLIAAVSRLGAGPDDILAVATIANLDGATVLRALLAAPGVKAEHLTTFLLRSAHSVELLADNKMRGEVRRIATGLRVQDMLAVQQGGFHATLVDAKNDGLRSWFLDSASADDLLWFAGHDGQTAPRALRFVQQKHGLGWVRELTSAANEKSLRIVALNVADSSTEKFIHEVLLGDTPRDPHAPTTVTKGAELPPDEAFVGEDERLETAIDNAHNVLARLSDLDATRRAHIAKDEITVKLIGSRVKNEEWARAAYLLDLDFTRTVKYSPGIASPTVAYLHTRPRAEELAALSDPELFRLAARYVHPNLLVVFPSLAEPKRLAKALEHNPKLLEFLLQGSDPNRVLALLSQKEVVEVATPLLQGNLELLAKLPRYKDMSAGGKAGLDRIAAADEDGAVSGELDELKKGNVRPELDAKRQGERLHEVDAKKTLVEKIEELAGLRTKNLDRLKKADNKHEPTAKKQTEEIRESGVNALALLDMHRDEVPALLNDRLQRPVVEKLAELIDLPPDVALPWLNPAELTRMPNALRWWLVYHDPTALLHHLRSNKLAHDLIVVGLNSHTNGVLDWMKRLPKGAALDASEERMFDELRPQITDAEALRALFEVRFGFPPPSEYDTKTLTYLYTTLRRLPSGHVRQGHIHKMVQDDLDTSNAAGLWDTGARAVKIDDNVRPGTSKDTFFPASAEEWQPKDAFKLRWGLDDARFNQLLGADRIQMEFHQEGAHGDFVYRMKEQKHDLFTQVVLHEVGHAVDEMLGNRTQPVFGYADWHEFDLEGGFDAWATELGGWDIVAANDKASIKKAFVEATRAKAPVKDMVPADHPVLDGKYAKVGIVMHARAGKTFMNHERIKQGSRVFVANDYYGKLFSLDANAAAVAPSTYSLFAPAEYFAESYVEYYRGVDGTPGSNAAKGGALATPVKTWFDNHVDKVRFDPERVRGRH